MVLHALCACINTYIFLRCHEFVAGGVNKKTDILLSASVYSAQPIINPDNYLALK